VHGLRRRQDDPVDAAARPVRTAPRSNGPTYFSQVEASPIGRSSVPGQADSQGREGRRIVQTIVCGIDGSPGARSALRVATELAGAFHLRVVAVHVVDTLGGDQKLDEPPVILRLRGRAERLLANVLYDEELVGRVDWRAEVGNVAEGLAAVAPDEQAILILLGARSKGKTRPFLRSRLAEEMAATSSIPVVVVPAQVTPAQAHIRSPGNLARRAKAPAPARPAAPNRAPLPPSRSQTSVKVR
jgi:nucleotide-binding universal stress UspA family protein